MTIERTPIGTVIRVTRDDESTFVTLDILCKSEPLTPAIAKQEAAEVLEALLHLPAETRYELHLLLLEPTTAEAFAGGKP
ncbi:MAG: hypothetical protein ACYCPT_01900 [Acidimicrobiales bacterium]